MAKEADGAGVFGYMKWAESKLREEEQRALKYLETSITAAVPGASGATTASNGPTSGSANNTNNQISQSANSVQNLVDSCVKVLVTSHKETILGIKNKMHIIRITIFYIEILKK